MRLMKVFLWMFAGIMLPVGLSAQTVSGKLIDENSQPLPYANVVLLSLQIRHLSLEPSAVKTDLLHWRQHRKIR